MQLIETGKIMETLSAFYGQGKSDTAKMVVAWHEILKGYSYKIVYQAVMEYAKHDDREYASFPAPGSIVSIIEREQERQRGLANQIFNSLYNGKPFEELTDEQQEICNKGVYERGLNMEPEELLEKQEAFKDMVRGAQKKLGG